MNNDTNVDYLDLMLPASLRNKMAGKGKLVEGAVDLVPYIAESPSPNYQRTSEENCSDLETEVDQFVFPYVEDISDFDTVCNKNEQNDLGCILDYGEPTEEYVFILTEEMRIPKNEPPVVYELTPKHRTGRIIKSQRLPQYDSPIDAVLEAIDEGYTVF